MYNFIGSVTPKGSTPRRFSLDCVAGRNHNRYLLSPRITGKETYIDRMVDTGIVSIDPSSYEYIDCYMQQVIRKNRIWGYPFIACLFMTVKDTITGIFDNWVVKFAVRVSGPIEDPPYYIKGKPNEERELQKVQDEEIVMMRVRTRRHCDDAPMQWYWD